MRSEQSRRGWMRAAGAWRAVSALLAVSGAAVAVASGAVAVSSAAEPVSSPAVAAPQVTEAWIRWLPGDLPAAAYLTVNNPGASPAVLLGASSTDYADISLHRDEMHQGSMQMLPVERLVIPAHTTRRFELLGYHFMLLRATRPIKPGDRVTMQLRFAEAPPLPVVFEVRKPDGSPAG